MGDRHAAQIQPRKDFTVQENTTTNAAEVPDVDGYLRDIGFASKEALETSNPDVRSACIEVLARQADMLRALAAAGCAH